MTELFIAIRYIRHSRHNHDIASSTRAVVVSIIVAIVFFIASLSIMNGYLLGIMRLSYELRSFHAKHEGFSTESEAESYRQLYAEDPRVHISGLYREFPILMSSIKKDTTSTTQQNRTTVMAFFRSIPDDIFEQDQGFRDCLTLVQGNFSIQHNEIMISEKTAKKLKVTISDDVFVTFMDEKEALIIRKYQISGIFTTGLMEYDEQTAFISNSTASRINLKQNYSLYIKIEDPTNIDKLILTYRTQGIFGLKSWHQDNFNELTAIAFQKTVIGFIVILVIFVAALTILTTVHISIHEKNIDIGILKAMGLPPQRVRIIFFLYGLFIGLLAIPPGIILGLLVQLNLNEIMLAFSSAINSINQLVYACFSLLFTTPAPQKIELFSSDFYLDKIYTSISFKEILFITIITATFSIITSIIPASRTINIKPKEVLK